MATTKEEPGRRGRPPAAEDRVPINGPSLRYAREELAHLTLDQVRRRVSNRLKRRAGQRRDKPGLPRSITEAAVSYWESGKTPTCGESVLNNLAVVLDVSPEFLMGKTDYVPVEIRLPGVRSPLRIEMNLRGSVASSGDDDHTWLLAVFTSLTFWRAVLLKGVTEEPAEGTQLTFLKHMVKALETILAPLEHGAYLDHEAVVDLLALRGSAVVEVVRARRAGAPKGH